ncbi:hypothetical protein [Marinobacterium sp. BA1]|uniref:hypothetical protein n=1 Tax=Marinobacterium sp. BA1 TaxID=3138931 RepID=UPI0032E562BF
MNERVTQAERNLTSKLNYGGIFVDDAPCSQEITMAYEMGDLADEVGQMRDLAAAFTELADALEGKAGTDTEPNAAVAAIAFALEEGSAGGIEFLRAWNEGDFQAIREEWPEAPEAVYIGADPLYQSR